MEKDRQVVVSREGCETVGEHSAGWVDVRIGRFCGHGFGQGFGFLSFHCKIIINYEH